MWKWILGLIVIIIVAAGAWKMGWIKLPASPAPVTTTDTTATTTQQQAVSSGLPTSQSDTSDAAVAQDEAAIDAQLSGMSQDSANVDSSLSDKPGQQSF